MDQGIDLGEVVLHVLILSVVGILHLVDNSLEIKKCQYLTSLEHFGEEESTDEGFVFRFIVHVWKGKMEGIGDCIPLG